MKDVRQTWMRTIIKTLALLLLTLLIGGCTPSSHLLKTKILSSELVQLKLNIETSVGESTPTEAEYGVPLQLVEVGVSRLDQSTGEQGGVGSGVMPNVTKVDDLDLSGSTTLEAQTKIKDWAMDELEETRVLLYNETEIPITLKDLGIEVDRQKTTEEIERNLGTALLSVLKVDSLKGSQELQEKLKNLSRPAPAKDASYKIEKDKFVVIQQKAVGRLT